MMTSRLCGQSADNPEGRSFCILEPWFGERSIKPFVIDRKNFLFANTPNGARGSAIMFSLIQTAIENGLDSYKYLTWLLKAANNVDTDDI